MEDHSNLLLWTSDPKNQLVSRPLKFCLLSFTFFFWMLGALFAAIGGWQMSQTRGYKDITDMATDAYAVFAALGCFAFTVSSFGLLGVMRENICLLRTYKRTLLTILVLQLCAGLVGFALWPEVKKRKDSSIRIGIQRYFDDPKLQHLMDRMQRGIGCCGSLSIMDWDSNGYYRCKYVGSYRSCGVPWSCCLRKYQRNMQCGNKIRKTRSKMDLAKYIHTIGCLDKFFEMMRKHMYLIGGVTVGTILLLLSGIVMSHRLMKQIRKTIILYNAANEKYGWNDPTREEEKNDEDNANLVSNTYY